MSRSVDYRQATLAGGCFWCTEAVFKQIPGVIEVEPGYAGGTVENATYRAVCTGKTKHAEAVNITYDTKVVSFLDLLEIFFAVHDPTTLNRQGADVGKQYRSAIFYRNQAQKRAAEKMVRKLEEARAYEGSIVTEIEPFETFHPAEQRHRGFYGKNPGHPYCKTIIEPKLENLKKQLGQ